MTTATLKTQQPLVLLLLEARAKKIMHAAIRAHQGRGSLVMQTQDDVSDDNTNGRSSDASLAENSEMVWDEASGWFKPTPAPSPVDKGGSALSRGMRRASTLMMQAGGKMSKSRSS